MPHPSHAQSGVPFSAALVQKGVDAEGIERGFLLSEVHHFTVQPCCGMDGEPMFSECVHVAGRSPIEAAQQVIKEPLSVHGKPDQVRARVWRLDELYKPVSILLYSAA